MNTSSALLVFSLSVCLLSCAEKAHKNIEVLEGILTLNFDKNIEEFIMDDFRPSWTDNCSDDVDSVRFLCRWFASKLISGMDTLFLEVFYIPIATELEQLDCSREDNFKEFNIPQAKVKIETCEIEYPNLYTEYLIIWQDNSIYEKFKKVYLNEQFTCALTGDFRNGQMDDKTKRKLKDLFKSSDVTFQSN